MNRSRAVRGVRGRAGADRRFPEFDENLAGLTELGKALELEAEAGK